MPVISEEIKKGGIVPPPVAPENGGDGGGPGDSGSAFPITKGQLAMWILLATIVAPPAGWRDESLGIRQWRVWRRVPGGSACGVEATCCRRRLLADDAS